MTEPPECVLMQDHINVYCYIFYDIDNAYTLRKLDISMLVQKEIQISDKNIQTYWNHQTTDIILEVRKELCISNGMSDMFMIIDTQRVSLKERNKVIHISSGYTCNFRSIHHVH